MVLAYQLLFIVLVIESSFLGLKAFITTVMLSLLFTITNVYTFIMKYIVQKKQGQFTPAFSLQYILRDIQLKHYMAYLILQIVYENSESTITKIVYSLNLSLIIFSSLLFISLLLHEKSKTTSQKILLSFSSITTPCHPMQWGSLCLKSFRMRHTSLVISDVLSTP